MAMTCAALAAALAASPQPIVVRGTISAGIGTAPIASASLRSLHGGTATATDRLGRFALEVGRLPDTIVVRAIGWRPDTLVVERPPARPMSILLTPAPVVLSDLMATATPTTPDLAESGRWRMPMTAARTVPPAVEPDVYRALALIPAVNFSSPLSARPLLRGYDAQDVTTRIDGFESQNLYHLGRIFSSFPADAAEAITVSAAPYTSAHGGSVAGLIDIQGRTGPRGPLESGGSLSFGAVTAFAGGGSERVRYFAATRIFYWKTLELIPKLDIPYRFEDLYAGVLFGPPDRPKGRLTVFATEDRAGHVADASFLHWSNLVVGGRWRVFDAGRTSVDVALSGADSRQRGDNVPGLHRVSPADLVNRFARVGGSVEMVRQTARMRATLGLSGGVRRIVNQIADHAGIAAAGTAGPTSALDQTRPEFAAWASLSRRFGSLAAEAALRADATSTASTLEPRLHVRWFAADGLEIAAAAGRTGRLYHLLAEPRSEPNFDFLDFWLDSADSIPAARVDHATLDMNLGREPLIARVSYYRSSGTGLGELRPETDQRPGPFHFFRFGRSRTEGLEAQIAYRGDQHHPYSLSLSYVVARSERNWGQAWVPWALDRRHQARAFGQLRTGPVNWFAAVDMASGLPVTPRQFTTSTGAPGAPESTTDRDRKAVYGPENSLATSGTLRADAGIAYAFGRPGRRFTLGVSVINLFGTAVAPFGDIDGAGTGPLASYPGGAPAPYRRLFTLPPIPTLTLRGEF